MIARQKQLTFAKRNHQLTNINIWTPDSQWILFDTRPETDSFKGKTIERVNIISGKIEVIYQAKHAACVGVVTVNPCYPLRYVFIHGPENPDQNWHYDFHHRRGVIITEPERSKAITLDAFKITPPYTAGALRGGSHVHVFSPDGSRISFTYNDHIMHEYDVHLDLRNVGVAVPLHPVNITKQHAREYSGSHFCVLISQTTANPKPGSDQINKAYEECWIGNQGYWTYYGKHQRWAIAFIGDTCSINGETVPEIFIVDLPEQLADFQCEGQYPIAGTDVSLPAPPLGVQQRRLTNTSQRRYPGVVNLPRHWLRSSPDGKYIAFLMCDDQGIVQVWLVPSAGGDYRQLTHSNYSVQSAFSWSHDGRFLAFVMDNSIVLCHINEGIIERLTERTVTPPCSEAVVFSPDDKKIAFMRDVEGYRQLFYVELTDSKERDH